MLINKIIVILPFLRHFPLGFHQIYKNKNKIKNTSSIAKIFISRLMSNVPEDLYLPVMWFEAIGQMSSNSAPTIRFLLKMPYIVSIVGPVIITFNLLIAVFLIFRIYRISQQKEFKTVNNIEDSPMNELKTFHEKNNDDEENAESGCKMKLICNNCI